MRTFNLFTLALLVLSFVACNDENRAGDWARVPSYGGEPRNGAVAFVINDIAYVGLGYGVKSVEYKSFKKYDYKTGQWYDVADFGGKGRHGAVAFVIDGKAYVGTGYITSKPGAIGEEAREREWLNDFWCYDPVADAWTEVASLDKAIDLDGRSTPGDPRQDAVAFSIGGYGYVGTGVGKDGKLYKDFYFYNPSANRWTKMPDFIGEARRGGTTFVIGGSAYVCLGGTTGSGGLLLDNNKFTPNADGTGTWKPMQALANKPENKQDKDYGRIPRAYAFSFITDKGNDGNAYAYIAGGTAGNTVWRYDHNRDTWHQREGLPFAGIVAAVGFSVNGYGYCTTGAGSYETQGGSTDSWKFFPDIKEERGNDYSASTY